MRSFDDLGVFWLPGHDDDRLTGRLRFDPLDGRIDLELVGGFDHESDDDDDATVRLNGWVGSERITLDRCFSAGHRFGSPGVASRRYHANRMFLGHHFAQSEDLEFHSVSLEVDHLSDWVGRTGLSLTDRPYDYRDEPTGEPIFEMSFAPPEQESARFARGKISLRSRWKRAGERIGRVEFHEWPVIRVDYDGPQAFDVILKDVGRIQDLVTLCIDAPSSADRVTVSSPNIKMRALSGDEWDAEQPVDFIAPQLRYVAPRERKRRNEYQMLLTFDEVGGTGGIARWMGTAQRFQRALDSMMSIRHTRQMFVENRFLNVTFAAEAFHRATSDETYTSEEEFQLLVGSCLQAIEPDHRDWLRERLAHANAPSLGKRLRRLSSRVAPAVRPLVGDKGQWAHTIAQVRNVLTHLSSDTQSFHGSDLNYLAESVYAVTRLCMLLEAGVHKDLLATKAESDSMTWYRQKLHESIQSTRTRLQSSTS